MKTLIDKLKEKAAKLALATALTLTALTGCGDIRTNSSEEITEYAQVAESVYIPVRTETTLKPTMDMEGNISLKMKTETIPEDYKIIFNFKDKKIEIHDKNIQSKFQKDQGAKVTYKRVYQEKYEDKKIVDKKLISYQFIAAEPTQLPAENDLSDK